MTTPSTGASVSVSRQELKRSESQGNNESVTPNQKIYESPSKSKQLVRAPSANLTGTSICSEDNYLGSPPRAISQTKNSNIPPELVRLNNIDKLIIKEKVKLLETFVGFEQSNEFELLLPDTNELLFRAIEHSGCCLRNCITWARPFDMEVSLNSGETMFVAKRTFKCCVFLRCCDCLCANYIADCFRDQISVYGTNEKYLYGTVQEAGSWIRPRYNVFNSMGKVEFKIRGPFFTCTSCGCCKCCPRCCRQARFKVFDAKTGERKGMFYKEFSGVVKELLTDADNFVIEFPEQIDVRMKTVLLSAVFLIDMIYFNQKK